MAKLKTVHRCTDCGVAAPKWTGRCPSCEAWNTLVEELEATPAASGFGLHVSPPGVPVPITDVDSAGARPLPTGVGELDRVLGGGLVPGAVTMLGGEPGAGKSTLLLDTAARVASGGRRALYVSAEEGNEQVRGRAG